jgi:heme/copper-type cytochrome/quinol oxidase subunit 4
VLAQLYLCGTPGPWAFLVSFVLCCLGALAFWLAAWRSRSWRLALGGGVVAGLAFVLQVLSLAVTLPGCSGV